MPRTVATSRCRSAVTSSTTFEDGCDGLLRSTGLLAGTASEPWRRRIARPDAHRWAAAPRRHTRSGTGYPRGIDGLAEAAALTCHASSRGADLPPPPGRRRQASLEFDQTQRPVHRALLSG